MNKKITAIIVTYFPDNPVVSKTIKSICNQVDRVFIVDNTPNGSDFFRDGNFLGENNIELITLNENVGIARAQNIGIKKALENRTDFVLLSDQDTFYPEKYADRMLDIYFNLSNKDKVATLAPDFIVPKNGRTRGGFILFDKDSVTVIRPESGCHQISQAIASGMVIPSEVFNDIGFMKEDLFIDSVDSEWCWRARARGYEIIGCADVVIEHCLGGKIATWWRYSHDVRAPIRDYYIVRNGIYLSLRSPYLSTGMKNTLFKTYYKYAILCIFFGKPHWKHLWYATKGFYHGLVGRLGPYK